MVASCVLQEACPFRGGSYHRNARCPIGSRPRHKSDRATLHQPTRTQRITRASHYSRRAQTMAGIEPLPHRRARRRKPRTGETGVVTARHLSREMQADHHQYLMPQYRARLCSCPILCRCMTSRDTYTRSMTQQ